MPLSDLFKRSPKNEPEGTTATPAAKPSSDPDFLSPSMQKNRYDAAMEFLKAFQERMPLLNGKPHAGTALAVAARLAGTSLYRALNNRQDVAPGVVVLSKEIDDAWPQLANIFAFYCKQNGVDVMAKPMVTKFPEKDKPLMDVDQVLQEYQDQYHEIMKRNGLDYLNSASAGIVVASIIFQYHYKTREIEPDIAAGIVAMGIVEGAKTAPPPLGVRTRTGTKKLSRLVLGEPDVVREAAVATGAIYIEINPGVLRMLREKNIDPYLIYEEGVKKQMEERIAQIDFVKVDVDRMIEEWHSKEQQAPIHVQLIFWLKNNAGIYGYEQNGNSWILKD